ncbi:MAG: deoxyribodipyrimidine photo-lyase [Spongiibacteraceae bacterium]
MTRLIWFRSDLRVDDNTALLNALRDAHRGECKVGAIFYATPGQWREHDMAPVKAEFIWRTLAQLRTSLAKLQVPLWVRVVPRYADIARDLAQFATDNHCDAVFANREYPVNETARDAAVDVALGERGILFKTFHDATLLPPGSVLTQMGQPFKVFTPFKRALIQRVAGETPQFEQPKSAGFWCDAPPLPDDLYESFWPYEKSGVPEKLWPAGEKAAFAQLQLFANEKLHDYRERRDFPLLDGTSRLSPYLALGVISIRRCLDAALALNGGQWAGGEQGADTWISELLWREFYIHVLSAFPQVCKYRPMRPETDAVAWRYDKEDFQRWCEGRTGFPLVDAAMRQLVQTGWMHNRLRMVTAMFLCKYLLIDWRWGEQFFMRHLIDGDLAANNGGWQWSASTGTDAAPYFRLLSPLRQAERFDDAGLFTKKMLPELANVEAGLFIKPGAPQLLAAGYPEPVVDLKMGRERALSAFTQMAAVPVPQKTVSRKAGP